MYETVKLKQGAREPVDAEWVEGVDHLEIPFEQICRLNLIRSPERLIMKHGHLLKILCQARRVAFARFQIELHCRLGKLVASADELLRVLKKGSQLGDGVRSAQSAISVFTGMQDNVI